MTAPTKHSLVIGQQLPDFTAEATSAQQISPASLRGKKVVFYFYPKDSTPGCTTEGGNFRDLYPEFQQNNTEIFGISRDGIKSHENFKTKQAFPFELISDKDETLCRIFDVIKLKKLYGKEHLGIERSTFLMDEHGKLLQEWRKVKVPGHAQAVLDAVKALD